jgi:hypothetical protein
LHAILTCRTKAAKSHGTKQQALRRTLGVINRYFHSTEDDMKLTNIYKKAGLAMVFLLSAHVAQAGEPPPASFSFGATVMDGPYAGTMGNGFVDYNEFDLFEGGGILSPDNGLLGFSFTILGQTFGMTDDDEYPFFPTVSFSAYMPTFIDFLVVEDGVQIIEPNVVSLGIDSEVFGVGADNLCPAVDIGNGCYDYHVEAFINVAEIPEVPVPAALWLFGSGLLGLAGIARKKEVA